MPPQGKTGSLYSTFGSGSNNTTPTERVQPLTDVNDRLEEWTEHDEKDDDARSDFSKEDVDVTTALIGIGPEDGAELLGVSGVTVGQRSRPKWLSWTRSSSSGSRKGKEQDLFDLEAIATQPSVFDNPDLAPQYQPRPDWENIHRFDPTFRWTWREEGALLRKIDWRIMVWTCIMFCALEMDRANIRQAVTDDLLPELGLDTNDYNTGNSLFSLSFLLAEVPSQLISKRLGPDRWIPLQMVLWSLVASSQFFLRDRFGFLLSRVVLGVLQGGFIPTVVLYLSYFYKAHELSIRLGLFWTAMVFADIFAAFSAFLLLHMRGTLGYSGWRWLFLVEGLTTLVVGLFSFGLMPAGPTQTGGSWFRGPKGWFTKREELILVNRVIRDDPSKGGMHNRERLTLKHMWTSLGDYDLWPMYLLGITSNLPFATPKIYLTLSLKDIGFTTFQSNLLVIPSQILHVIAMMVLTYVSEITSQLSLTALFPQLWALPFLLFLRFNTSEVSKWAIWVLMSLFLGYPYAHPIQVSWVSRNAGAIRSRLVGSAMYNMCVQGGGIIAANIYRADDAPQYLRGNTVLLCLTFVNVAIYMSTRAYYRWRNRKRDAIWGSMTEAERVRYLATTKDEGNKRLDFRFAF